MKLSLIVPTFNRANLLRYGLYSILNQDRKKLDIEILVINDGEQDETESVCQEYSQLNIRYFYIGNRKKDRRWVCPVYPINYGVSQSTGEIIILTCPEIYHLDETLSGIHDELLKNDHAMASPMGRDDHHGAALEYIKNHGGKFDREFLHRCSRLNDRLPFCMGMKKHWFEKIGGYNEQYDNGIGYEDAEFINRAISNGIQHVQSRGMAIHLYHDRRGKYAGDGMEMWKKNKILYEGK